LKIYFFFMQKSDENIGGEYYFSPSILFQKGIFSLENYMEQFYNGYHYFLTGGGYFSIKQILDMIPLGGNEFALLPSYLCPSILLPFKEKKIPFRFYNVDRNLVIDLNDLMNKADKSVKCCFFINYFGFPHLDETYRVLLSLKSKGIVLIEDRVQSFFSQTSLVGDYIFNSFRKFIPVDGGLVITKNKLIPRSDTEYYKYNYFRLSAQLVKHFSIEHKLFNETHYLKLFNKSNSFYHNPELKGFNKLNRFILSRINVLDNLEIRRKNHQLLYERLQENAVVKDPPNNQTTLLGFPVRVRERNARRKELVEAKIYCPIHWSLPEEVSKKEFPESWELSENILTIPLGKLLKSNHIDAITNILSR
jgi:dTDP-4-amino-4,6-dideoxygalactose transaminase